MSRGGAGGLAVGALAAGVAAGAAIGRVAERRLVGRRGPSVTAPDGGLLGSMRSDPRVVTTDDGVDLWVEVDPARPGARHADVTVVAAHGFALNLDFWHYQRRGLSGVARTVWWDQRGHGRSNAGPPGSHHLARLGRDMKAVIDAVAPEGPLILLGHSMGGMTVMSMAGQFPELASRVIGVGLVSTSSGQMEDVTLGFPTPVARFGRRLAPSLIRRVAAMDPESGIRRLIAESDLTHVITRLYSFASPVPPATVEVAQQMVTGTSLEIVAEFLPSLDAFDGGAGLVALRSAPAVVLVGDADRLTPPLHSELIAAELPAGRLTIVDRGGHLLPLEHPNLVTEEFRGLLDARP